ncbi:phage tail protein [Streptomyces werraensis]|uniref:phage tail protein n=1 Tax=Streptomyces werraensis TaxID=68284 RepID=UPI003446FF1F
MPAGQVIGRVSVRVLPDTSEFRRRAQKDLDRIEKQLKVNVELVPVMGNFVSEMLKEIRKLNQQNRQMNSRKVRLYTTLALSNIPNELRKAVRRYEDIAKSEKVSLKTTLDTTEADLKISDQSLRDMTDQLKDWRDRNSPQKIDLELNWPAGAGAYIDTRLAILTRPRTVSIIPRLNNAAMAKVAAGIAALSGIRVVNNLFTKFSNIIKNLDKNVPIIGTLATAVAGLAGWALSASSNLFALSASLAQIGATALTLPGILGGFAVGIGVTIAALKDFNKEIPGVKAQLAELQNQISSNFWAQARAPIQELVDVLLPRFAEGFRATATASGQFFGSFATQLTEALNPQIVDEMFGYLNESITEATKGTDTFASIIAQLGEVGTSYLPDLAGWFVNISEEFDAWLKKKGELGLKAEIDQGIQSLKDLGGILVETGGIFAGIARAATEAGGSTLGMFRETLAGIHDAVDSSGVQQKLVDLFTAAHTAMANISAGGGAQFKAFLGEISGLLTDILPQVGSTIGEALGAISEALSQTAVIDGVKAMFDGIQGAVSNLAPLMMPLGAALGAIMDVVAAMLPVFGELITAAFTPLADAVTALAPALIPLVEILGGALTGIFAALGPLIMAVVQAVVPLVQNLVAGLAPILTTIVSGFQQIVVAVTPVVTLLLQLLTAIITPLIPLFQHIVDSIMPPLIAAFQQVSEALQPFLQALIQVVNFLMPVLIPAIQFFIDLIIGSLVMALDGIVNIITGVLDVIMGIWEVFAGLFTGDWDRAWNGVKQIFSGIWDIIVGVFEVVINVGILGFLKKGMALIKSLWTGGWNAIKSFFTNVWNAMKGGLYVVWNAIKGYIDDGLAKVGSLWRGGWNAVRQFFEDLWFKIQWYLGQAWTKIEKAVSQGIDNVIKFVKDLPKKAQQALSNIGSTLKNAGKQLIKGFITGITSMFGGVQEALGNLTDKLTSWKGPESLDRVLLVNAGQLVIGGFIKGLESRYAEVRRSLRGLTQDVASTEFAVPGVNAIGVSRGVSSAVGSSLAGSAAGGTTKVLNYYAAPGSSLGSEEDLFAAANRARFGW